jgi:hypothetical protein
MLFESLFYRSRKHCPNLRNFFSHQHITFASVDTRGDKDKLFKHWFNIPYEYHVDIQDLYRFEDTVRAGMARLASTIIDPWYEDMKKKFIADDALHQGHYHWEWYPLAKLNLKYSAIDGYVSYELYRRIKIVNDGQHHLQPIPSRNICPNCKTEEDSSKMHKHKKINWEW